MGPPLTICIGPPTSAPHKSLGNITNNEKKKIIKNVSQVDGPLLFLGKRKRYAPVRLLCRPPNSGRYMDRGMTDGSLPPLLDRHYYRIDLDACLMGFYIPFFLSSFCRSVITGTEISVFRK